MNEYFITSNFEDSGKLLGLFEIRNAVEAGIMSLPFAFMGINDDPLSVFAVNFYQHFVSIKSVREHIQIHFLTDNVIKLLVGGSKRI